MSTSIQKPTLSAGEERLKSDMRQFSGLMFALAICVTFQPLANVSSAIGPNGTTPTSGLPLAGLIAGCIVIFVGSFALYTAALGAFMDTYNKTLTLVLLFVIQLAWMPFLTDLTAVGLNASAGTGFVPGGTETDNRFVGAMGMIGILTYASSFVGSLAFMAFSLYAYQTGMASARSASYYRGRLTYYTVLVTLAGLSQLMLGAYVLSRFGGGPISPPIGVAIYVVHFPEINVFVGLVQLLTGIFGVFRRYGKFNNGVKDNRYQTALFFTWMCMLSMQVLTQVGYTAGGELASAAPTIACVSVGLIAAPAFLDYKMRSLPEVFPANYYGMDEPTEMDEPVDLDEPVKATLTNHEAEKQETAEMEEMEQDDYSDDFAV